MPSQDIPLIGPILNKIFGSRNERFVKRYTLRVEAINALESQMRLLSDEQIRAKTIEFRKRFDAGEKADDLLVEVYAVAREAMDRNVGIRSIFNPEHAFDASRLAPEARRLYDETKAAIDALSPAAPEGRFLGCPQPVPGWMQVDIPVALYEAVRELIPESRPPFRARPFDVQLIGGMVLGQGKIAEMKTGEGKTIVAPLATYMASIQRQQVHVVTVNDYLVQRDRDWTFPFFMGLGLTVGAIHPQHTQPEEVKRQMYMCDIVYGTTSEFGFDYLRDNMKRSVEQQVQKKRQFAVVDEVDSILIDEARTPLIISGPAHEDAPRYDLSDRLARHLVEKQKPWQQGEDKVRAAKERIKGLEGDIRQTRDKANIPTLQKQLEEAKAALPEMERQRDQHTQYYELQMDRRQSHLTHEGIAEAQRVAGIGSFYVDENMDVPHLLEQSLRAHAVYQRDKDYIVMDLPDRMTGRTEASVVIVDVNTGRPMIGRQWSDGLHQAVEAKEGVPIKQETQTVASVTIQNFYKMYKRLAGMTGTADTEAQEFHDIYGLDVVSIPTNKPIVRRDFDDLLFLRQKDKWEAIVDEIKQFHDAGRPILVGTTSVEKSEMLGQMLMRKYSIKHEILNAKQHEREANIVENAGQLGAVMIATNMAGRGTDIKLGSCPREKLLDHWLRRGIASRGLTVNSTDAELRENIFRKIAATELKEEGVKKKDVEQMPFEEVEIMLLRHWAQKNTWVSPNKIASMSAGDLMDALDQGGRFLLHRIRWFASIEELGGLHVIGTERHESRRIDNQLRGRSGRQGDNGSSRFFVSLEDDLMKMFAGETTMRMLSRLGMKEGDAIEHPWLSKNVERAQRKVEERNFQIRKNILEYDEVMEHQRQRFYGLRQRVLEGRDVKGLIFEYIEEAVDDAIAEFLDTDYPSQCAAEFARQKLEFSIQADKLRGKSLDEMDLLIRKQAKEDAASMIDVTLGEYMPVEGSEIAVDFDSAGLVNWAKRRFDVELDAAELREGGAEERRHVRNMLERAAFERIDAADLSGLAEFVAPNYGAERLSEWVKAKFGFDTSVEEIVKAQQDENRTARDPIMDKARTLYREREIFYPVDFIMELTMMYARQSPADAFRELGIWSRRRFGLELSESEIRSTPPAKMRERLVKESEKFVDEDRLGHELEAAVAIADDAELEAHLQERLGAGATESMRYLEGEEREQAIRARVENLLRTELLHFERTILIDTLDQAWREHLYAMDQLRDGISFRAFSQQDPRIAFKREGSRQFLSMMETVRDRVTDYIFKARISPAAAMRERMASAPQPAQPPQRPTQRPPAAPSLGGGAFGGGITGPGFGGPSPV
ncbi:MAG: preprotein translocase subunit SecA [Phycisphaeraceae bacterium]|nr:preprotein translocase subunit SecA [Phycisphaeraceae bacterium]MCW5762227.1 preprotein translocase subunit SecA [Phycisphaeraceae bacterium]